MTVARLAPGAGEVWTVVSLTVGGRTWRFALAQFEAEDDAGDPVEVTGGLVECRVSEPASVGSQTATGSISFRALWPTPIGDLVAAGVELAGMVGEVARWREGTSWDARRVVLDGRVRSPVYGDATEALAGTIEADVDDDSALQEPLARVSSATWNAARYADADEGRPYPIAIGCPGLDPQDADGWHTSGQLVFGEAEAYWQVGIISVGPIDATEVWINSDGDTDGALVPVRHRTDALGRMVAVVDYNLDGLYQGGSGDIGNDLNPGTTNPIAIHVGFAAGGGILGPDGKVIRHAGDVLTWACAGFRRRRMDRGRLAAAATQLRGYLIDAVIGSDTTVADWLSGTLLPILPVSMVHGGRGSYPVVWRFDATGRDAVYHIDIDAGVCARTAPVTVSTDDIRNDLALEYGYSSRTGRYLYTARLGVAVEERASVIMEGYLGDRIRIRARTWGSAGAGVVISYTDTGGATLITEDVEARTVALEGSNAVTTALAIVDVINTNSELVEAEILAGTGDHYFQAGAANQERDYTTALRRSQGQVGSAVCAASQAMLRRVDPDGRVVDDGVRAWSGQTRIVDDQATAYRILHWMADAYAGPEVTTEVVIPEAGAEHVERGSVVLLSDASVGFAERVCLVLDAQAQDTGWLGLALRVLRRSA